ncbi:ribosome biogenesis GTPase Der [Nitrospira sp. MA-1]|nr:ribosome biogenesis GTPase Der [Nitrospira sp. MA-1]
MARSSRSRTPRSRTRPSLESSLSSDLPVEFPLEPPPHRPLVALVGRPNVGKSTLFNRIVGHRTAIVDDVSGVTRDRNTAECDYQNRIFTLVDTGGLDLTTDDVIVEQIKFQTQAAIEEADLIIAVMDGRVGLSPLDADLVKLLRPVTKPVFLAVNKIDTPQAEPLLADFYKLGAKEIFPISAEGGLGVDELLEALLPYLPQATENEVQREIPRIAVVGRPNVGKSTLVNAILGEQRLIVSDIPGTTRDPIDSMVSLHGRRYIFTDTAGLRRRGRIERGIEGYSVVRAIRALGRSDVAVLVLDGVEGVTEQDTKIAGLISKQGRGCIILVNKWDLRADDREAYPAYNLELARRFPFFTYVPVVFGAAIQSETLTRIFPKIDQVVADFSKRIQTRKLNLFVQELLEKNPMTLVRGNPKKSVFITQVATKPPTFALFVKSAPKVPASYLRYLENSIRTEYGFEGIPLRILLRSQ